MKSNQRQSFIRGALFSYLGPRVQPMSIAWEKLPTDLAHLEQGVRRACRGNLLANDELTDLPDFLVQLQSLLDEQYANANNGNEEDDENNNNGDDQEMDPENNMSPEDLCAAIAQAMTNFDADAKAQFMTGLQHLLRAGMASDQPVPATRGTAIPGGVVAPLNSPVTTQLVPVKAKNRRPARPAMDSAGFMDRWPSLRDVKVGSGVLVPPR